MQIPLLPQLLFHHPPYNDLQIVSNLNLYLTLRLGALEIHQNSQKAIQEMPQMQILCR